MINDSQIKLVLDTYRRLPREQALKTLTFVNNPLFEIADLHINKNGWIYSQDKYIISAGAINIHNIEEHYDNLLTYSLVHNESFSEVSIESGQESEFLKGRKGSLKRNSVMLMYDNRREAIELIGPKFQRFRTAYKYLEDTKYTIEEYSNENKFTLETLLQIKDLNSNWSKKKKSAYDINDSIETLYRNQNIEFYLTVIKYDNQILHYHTSNSLTDDFICLVDSRPNYGIDSQTAKKFQYTYFLAHHKHLVYWSNRYKRHLVYHSGNSDKDSYKMRLRPSEIREFKTYRVDRLGHIENQIGVFGSDMQVVQAGQEIGIWTGDIAQQSVITPCNKKTDAHYLNYLSGIAILNDFKRVLNPGLGAGSIISQILHHKPKQDILSIDIEPYMCDLAHRYHGIDYKYIVEADIVEYIENIHKTEKYDLILHDIFALPVDEDDELAFPPTFDKQYFDNLIYCLSENGLLAVNWLKECSSHTDTLIEYLKSTTKYTHTVDLNQYSNMITLCSNVPIESLINLEELSKYAIVEDVYVEPTSTELF